jgi:hypothetical protein
VPARAGVSGSQKQTTPHFPGKKILTDMGSSGEGLPDLPFFFLGGFTSAFFFFLKKKKKFAT